MARKPIGDMGGLGLSKAAAAGKVPFASAPAAATMGAPKGLTIKLDAETYTALLDYCHEQTRSTGTKATHQAVMLRALRELLERHKAA